MAAKPAEPPSIEYGCYDCGMGVPFLDGVVVFLLIAPVAIAIASFAYRMLRRLGRNGDGGIR